MKLNIDTSQNIIRLSENPADNIYLWEGFGEYRLEYLNREAEERGSKGGNSAVFRLVSTEDDEDVSVIKFLKYPLSPYNRRMNERFQREIDALTEARTHNSENIIQIKHEDTYKHKEGNNQTKKYRFYIMEKADDDLGAFIPNDENLLTISQKMSLCKDIIKGIIELHKIGIYHRDIKPDNIFLVSSGDQYVWKIGDLGLLAKRGEDFEFEKSKKIGPANWLSPEAMNKWLCEGTSRESFFDVKIDDLSDAYQLGAVIWFIFNHNAPIGQLYFNDFLHKDHRVFNATVGMLQYAKNRRKPLGEYLQSFDQIEHEYLSMGVESSIKKSQTLLWNIRNFGQRIFCQGA